MFNHDRYKEVPERTLTSLDRYAKDRIPPGSFGTAVLTNDLAEAVGRADRENRQVLPKIVEYAYNELPAGCWGNDERVEEWLKGDNNE